MAKRIAGITIELSGDTTKLQKALSGVDGQIKKTASALSDIGKLLKFNPGNTELLSQQQKALATQVENTRNRLKELRKASEEAAKTKNGYSEWKAALEPVNQKISEAADKAKELRKRLSELEAAGKVDTKEYEELKNELSETEKAAKDLKDEAKQLTEEFGHPLSPEQWDSLQREIAETEGKLEQLESEYRNFGSVAAQQVAIAGEKMKEVGDKISGVGDKMKAIGSSLTTRVTLPIAGAFGASVKAVTDWETAFTGVRKTVDATEGEFEELSDWIKEASTRMNSSKEEIAGVMEVAGQLGVSGVEDLKEFTETMVMLGDSTNLSSDEAATAIARFMNITGESKQNASNLGSAIVDLGNNFATSESEIMNMATRLASSGTIAGLTSTDILALAASMSSVGIEAEAGGTAMSQTLAQITKNVEGFKGGTKNNLDEIARIAGMTSEQFAVAWENRPAEAVQSFVSGLGSLDKSGESAVLVLDSLGMSGIRQSNMLQSLALASEVMEGALRSSGDAYRENNALQQEASKRYETTSAKMTQAKENIKNLGLEIGERLLPYVDRGVDFIDKLVDRWDGLDDKAKDSIIRAALVAAAAGPVISAVGNVTTGLGGLAKGIGGAMTKAPQLVSAFSKISGTFSAAGGGISGVGAALGGLASPAGIAVAAVAGITAVVVTLWHTNEDFRNKMTEIWDGISSKLSEAGQRILDAINSLGFDFSSITEMMGAAWTGFCDLLAPYIEGVFAFIGGIIGGFADTFSGVIQMVAGLLNLDFKQAWEGAKTAVKGAAETMTAPIKGIGTTVAGAMEQSKKSSEDAAIATMKRWQEAGASVNLSAGEIATAAGKSGSAAEQGGNKQRSAAEAAANAVSLSSSSISADLGKQTGAQERAAGKAAEYSDAQRRAAMQTAIATGQSVDSVLRSMDSQAKAVDKSGQAVSKSYKAIETDTGKALNAVKKNNSQTWSGIEKDTKKSTEATSKAAKKEFGEIKKDASKEMDAVKKTMTEKWGQIKTQSTKSVKEMTAAVEAEMKALSAKAKTWGQDMMANYASGIAAKQGEVTAAAKAVAQSVKDNLGFSEPKEGPLSDFHTYGPDMMNLYAQGINENSGQVKTAVEGVAGSVKDGLSSAGGAAEEAGKSVSGAFTDSIAQSISIFDEFDRKTELSAAQMISNMKNQVKGVEEWSENLKRLAKRGVSEGILKELTQLGPSGYEKVKAFTEMTDKQLKQANSLYAKSLALPQSAATSIEATYRAAGLSSALGFADSVLTGGEQIKTNVGATGAEVQAISKAAWENVKTDADTNMNALVTNAAADWRAAESDASTKTTSIKTTASTNFTTMKSEVSGHMLTLSQDVQGRWQNMDDTTKTYALMIAADAEDGAVKVNNGYIGVMNDHFLPNFDKVWATADEVLATRLQNMVTNAQEAAKAITEAMGGDFFETESGGMHSTGGGWTFPTYAKAYNNPVLFKRPTVIPTPSGWKGFGDGHGAEIVMGLNKLRELVGSERPNVYMTINGNGQDAGELADAVMEKLNREIYRQQAARGFA